MRPWEASEGQTTWTFTLRDDVTFHDGNEFGADDVAACNRILDPEAKSASRTFISSIERVEEIDEHTVAFHLKHPWQALLPYLATTSMSGPIPSKESVEAGAQNRQPVGTGPFRFADWSSGDRIVVEKFEDYWNEDAKPHLDRITFRILPDTQTRYASLQSGEVDVIWTDRGPTIVEAMKDPGIVHLSTIGAGAAVNLVNTRVPPLDDERVRQAIAHAWNQDALVQISWQNTRPAVTHPLGPVKDCGEAGYPGYDPEKAKALVADCGKPIEVTMIHTATPRGRELGELMQQMAKQVGITINLEPVDQSTLVARTFKRDFGITGWRIADGADMGPQLFAHVHAESNYNLTGWSDPEMDELAQRMRVAATREERLDLQCEMVEMWNRTGSMHYRGGGEHHAFTTPRVKNVPPPYRGVVDVTQAWIDE